MEESSAQILIATHDRFIKAALAQCLEGLGTVAFAKNKDDILAHNAALIILSDEFCTESSLVDTCAGLTKALRETPVIIISAVPLDSDIAIKNKDVFDHPVRIGAFYDRVRVHLGKIDRKNGNAPVRFGGYELSPADGVLQSIAQKAAPVYLTEKERDILLLLHERHGENVDKKEMLDTIWGFSDQIETHTLETHIYRLRQKIEKDPANPDYIINDGSGYRLNLMI